MKTSVKQLDSIHVAFVRRKGPYGPEVCGAAFEALSAWAGPLGFFEKGPVLALYWDDPQTTPPEECRMDACVGVPEGTTPAGEVQLQTVAAGPYAVCSFEITTYEFPKAWEQAFGWVLSEEFPLVEQPCVELYYNDATTHPEDKWLVDICIPLKEMV